MSYYFIRKYDKKKKTNFFSDYYCILHHTYTLLSVIPNLHIIFYSCSSHACNIFRRYNIRFSTILVTKITIIHNTYLWCRAVSSCGWTRWTFRLWRLWKTSPWTSLCRWPFRDRAISRRPLSRLAAHFSPELRSNSEQLCSFCNNSADFDPCRPSPFKLVQWWRIK